MVVVVLLVLVVVLDVVEVVLVVVVAVVVVVVAVVVVEVVVVEFVVEVVEVVTVIVVVDFDVVVVVLEVVVLVVLEVVVLVVCVVLVSVASGSSHTATTPGECREPGFVSCLLGFCADSSFRKSGQYLLLIFLRKWPSLQMSSKVRKNYAEEFPASRNSPRTFPASQKILPREIPRPHR